MRTKRRYFVIEDEKPREVFDPCVMCQSIYLYRTDRGSDKFLPGKWYYIEEPISEPEVEFDGWCLPRTPDGKPDAFTFIRIRTAPSNNRRRRVRLIWADEVKEETKVLAEGWWWEGNLFNSKTTKPLSIYNSGDLIKAKVIEVKE